MPLGVLGESPLAFCLDLVGALASDLAATGGANFAFELAAWTTTPVGGGTEGGMTTEEPEALPLVLCCGTVAIGPTSAADPAAPKLPLVVVPDPKPGRGVAEPVARPAKPVIAAAAADCLPTWELAGEVPAGEIVGLECTETARLDATETGPDGTALATAAAALAFATAAALAASAISSRACLVASDVPDDFACAFAAEVLLIPLGGSSKIGSYPPVIAFDFGGGLAGVYCVGGGLHAGGATWPECHTEDDAAVDFGGGGAYPLFDPVITPGL